jgi:hypothetical protein
MLPLFLYVAMPVALPEVPMPTVTIAQIAEARFRQLEKTNIVLLDSSQLEIVLNVHGLTNEARWIGNCQIEKAVDDRGADLRPNGKTLKSFVRFIPPTDPFSYTINLKTSNRAATKLSHFCGKLSILTSGESKAATFHKLKELIGKKLNDPTLRAAGIEAELISLGKKDDTSGGNGDNNNQFQVRLTGQLSGLDYEKEQVYSISVTDGSGTSALAKRNGIINVKENGNEWVVQYTLNQPISDVLTLTIKVRIGQKEVAFPFDFKDIVLP